jgi:hypothetical protein
VPASNGGAHTLATSLPHWEDGFREMKGPLDAVRLGAALGGAAADRATRLASRGALATADAVLESRLAADIAERLLASPLMDRLGRDIPRHRVIERIVEPVVASGELDELVNRALDSPALERLANRVLESAAAERLVARVIEGPLFDEAVARLLESEDLWLIVDVVAQSPAVTEAISRQSIGFADQVAGAVRARSSRADERLEGAARRLLRRPARLDVPAPDLPAPEP